MLKVAFNLLTLLLQSLVLGTGLLRNRIGKVYSSGVQIFSKCILCYLHVP